MIFYDLRRFPIFTLTYFPKVIVDGVLPYYGSEQTFVIVCQSEDHHETMTKEMSRYFLVVVDAAQSLMNPIRMIVYFDQTRREIINIFMAAVVDVIFIGNCVFIPERCMRKSGGIFVDCVDGCMPTDVNRKAFAKGMMVSKEKTNETKVAKICQKFRNILKSTCSLLYWVRYASTNYSNIAI